MMPIDPKPSKRWSGKEDSNLRPLPPEECSPPGTPGESPILRVFEGAANREMTGEAGTVTGTGVDRWEHFLRRALPAPQKRAKPPYMPPAKPVSAGYFLGFSRVDGGLHRDRTGIIFGGNYA